MCIRDRGVTVDGFVRFDWSGECRRCLDEVVASQQADISEVFQTDAPDDSEDVRNFDGVHIDLLPTVKEAVAFGLPMSPLCSTDCKGPAPEQYPAKLENEKISAPDPRWAALDAIKFD